MWLSNNIRKIIIYTLVCIYSLALIKPITPIVNDVVAHTFFKMTHMATVHFENGKYHIHAELQKESQETPSKSTTTPTSIFETLANHLKNETNSMLVDCVCISNITFPYIKFLVDICLKSPTPPPKA